MSKKIKIFISYRRDDGAGEAGRIYDTLKNKFEIFFDTEEIRTGADFHKKIDKEIKESTLMLSIIGKNSIEEFQKRLDRKDYVSYELEYAKKQKVPVLPILVSNAEMPSKDLFPPSINFLSDLNAFEVRNGKFSVDIASLSKEITNEYGDSKLKKNIFLSIYILIFLSLLFFSKEPLYHQLKLYFSDKNVSAQNITNWFSLWNSSNNTNIVVGGTDNE